MTPAQTALYEIIKRNKWRLKRDYLSTLSEHVQFSIGDHLFVISHEEIRFVLARLALEGVKTDVDA